MLKSIQNSFMTCPDCQVGKYKLQLVTFYAFIGEELITVPDFPCWVCDVCKRRDYDQKAVSQVYMVLNADLGKPVLRGRKPSPSKLPESRSRRPQPPEK